MDIPRLLHMKAYWEENPPIHMMVRAYLGIKSKPKEEEKGDLAELIGMIPQTLGT